MALAGYGSRLLEVSDTVLVRDTVVDIFLASPLRGVGYSAVPRMVSTGGRKGVWRKPSVTDAIAVGLAVDWAVVGVLELAVVFGTEQLRHTISNPLGTAPRMAIRVAASQQSTP